MPAPRIDTSRPPLFVVTFDGIPSEAEFDAYLATTTRLLIARKQKTVTIVDSRRSGRVPASLRKKQAEWLKQYENLLTTYSVGTVFVIDSPLVRGALTAILWLQPLPTAHAVVATLAQAESWAVERLREAGIDASPAPASGSRR